MTIMMMVMIRYEKKKNKTKGKMNRQGEKKSIHQIGITSSSCCVTCYRERGQR